MDALQIVEARFPNSSRTTEEMQQHAISSFDDGLSPGLSILISGSRVEGIWNELSDLDIYLIADKDDPTATGAANIEMKEGIYIDTEFHHLGKVEEVVDCVRRSLNTPERLVDLTLDDLDLSYRLAIADGIVLTDLYNRGPLGKLDPDSIGEVFGQYCSIYAQLNLLQATRIISHVDSAAMYLHEATRWAIDAILATKGEAFPSRKWRHEKAKRVGVSLEDRELWWSLETAPLDLEFDAVEPLVASALELTNLPSFTVEEFMMEFCTPRTLVEVENGAVWYSKDGRIGPFYEKRKDTNSDGRLSELLGASQNSFTPVPFHYDGNIGFSLPRFPDTARDHVIFGRSGIDALLWEGRKLHASGEMAAAEFDMVGALRAEQAGMAYMVASEVLDLCMERLVMEITGFIYIFRDRAELYWCAQQLEHRGKLDGNVWSQIRDILRRKFSQSDVRSFCNDVLNVARHIGLQSAADIVDDKGNAYRRRVRDHFAVCGAIGCRTSLHDFFQA